MRDRFGVALQLVIGKSEIVQGGCGRRQRNAILEGISGVWIILQIQIREPKVVVVAWRVGFQLNGLLKCSDSGLRFVKVIVGQTQSIGCRCVGLDGERAFPGVDGVSVILLFVVSQAESRKCPERGSSALARW